MSEWKLVGELVAFQRSPVVPEELRPFMSLDLIPHEAVILHDPVLEPGENWLRVHQTRGPSGVRFLHAFTKGEPRMSRYYRETEPGTGYVTEDPLYEGHWRSTLDEKSPLPWPLPDAEWNERATFLEQLAHVEAAAARIVYRGLSMCRVCGARNGHVAFRLQRWEWPEGFRHYIAAHGVRPSSEFAAFVAQRG